ncbi:sulfotransferase [cf. Phormidesmis sp. LEGE 11477]|uniref:sulfotransferase n=1 Tax=cf. Phormidesmis sp. LEGE 11477 TaxID=1828680 RepID=UPI00187F40F6|nr:sulfotransferase [cf. Phormidesmis sp. LEGE 11477]MBE9064409.1 sulfotransferase [cf. Phormidesmis sp. LEGE 11477]
MQLTDQTSSPDSPYLHRLKDVAIAPIFILGDQRSGTTMLYKTLADAGCFNVVRAYHIINYDEILSNHFNQKEDLAIRELEARFQALGICDRKIDRVTATPHLPEEYGFILKNIVGDELFITAQNLPVFQQLCRKIQIASDLDKPLLLKNPGDFSQFLYVKQVVPQAKFIFIHRHPIHLISSRIKASRSMIYDWNAYTALISPLYAQIFSNPIKRTLIRILFSKYLGIGLHRSIQTSIEATTYFMKNIGALPKQDYISIKYEDLCKAPESTIKQIMAFLTLEDCSNLDYSQIIKPRPLNLLPGVQKRAGQIKQRSREYFDYHGYS